MLLNQKLTAFVGTIFILLFLCTAAFAHEFVIIPEERAVYKAEVILPLALYSTHTLLQAEELEAIELNKLYYNKKEVKLNPNHEWLRHDAQIIPKKGEAAILSAHRLPILWAANPKATKTKHEKFAKLIIAIDNSTENFNQIIGQRLEIVPLDNPLTAKVGDKLRFAILLDNKPARFEMLYATYANFSDIPSAWAFVAPPTAHGEGSIQITQKGLWFVCVSVKIGGEQPEQLSSSLSFIVAE